MKIGDEVYIHGYIDEIRKDTIIIKNDGGYFGTIPSEISDREPEPCEDCISRQAVLNILDYMTNDYAKSNDFEKVNGVAWVKVQKLPPVTQQEPKTDILDKIREEIEGMAKDEWNHQVGSVSQGLEDALEIIDKYRREDN